MRELVSDIGYALRALRRAPGFFAVIVLTLMLGIGANSAMFTVLNSVVLRPLPYPRPDRLVRLTSRLPEGMDRFWLSAPEFFALKARHSGIAAMGGYRTNSVNFGGAESPFRVTSGHATHDLFTTLGVAAHIGWAFNAEEDLPGADPVATLSYELWQRAFAGDTSIIGRTVLVNGNQVRVTGIMPPAFEVADEKVEIWLPLRLDPESRLNRDSHFLNVIARLEPGVSLAAAKRELAALVSNWAIVNPEPHTPTPEEHPLFMAGLQDDLLQRVKPALNLLFGAVGFVLLIACANVANLLLARAESRQPEIALRMAIGASRGRLARQLLTEGLVLSLIGGALGIALGQAGIHMLIATNPVAIPRASEIATDGPVLAFTLLVSMFSALLFAAAPLLQQSRVISRTASIRVTSSSATLRTRRLLVTAELALALTLVVGAALMIRSFTRLLAVDPGFRSAGLLAFEIYLPASLYREPASQATFYTQLSSRLAELPGVTAVAAMFGRPPRRDANANDTEFEGQMFALGGALLKTEYWQSVTAGYLETMHIPLQNGRGLQLSDETGPPVVLINETLAKRVYPDVNPLGRRLRPALGVPLPWFTIVGVVKDVKQGGVEKEAGTELYFLHQQILNIPGMFAPRTMNFVLRSHNQPQALVNGIRNAVRSVDRALPISNVATMDEVVRNALARPRFLTLLLTTFAALAMFLAIIGIYGVMSYSVTVRQKEIAIRMALGARASEVLRLIMRQGLSIAAAGLFLGMVAAFALTRLMQAMLFEVGVLDAVAFGAAVSTLALVSVLACLIPTLRAARVQPATAIGHER